MLKHHIKGLLEVAGFVLGHKGVHRQLGFLHSGSDRLPQLPAPMGELAAQQRHRMAQVLIKLRQREGAAGGVVAEFGCGHHHLGVAWALVVDGAAFLSVVGAGSLEVGGVMHAQQGLLQQALAVGADGAGPVARRHAGAALAHPDAAGRRGGGVWGAGGHGVRLWRMRMGWCPPLVGEVVCESVEARKSAAVVQAYHEAIGPGAPSLR